MTDRRSFLLKGAAATAGLGFCGCAWGPLANAAQPGVRGQRRQVVVGGRRVRTIDIHAHVNIIGVLDLFKEYRSQLINPTAGTEPEWSMDAPAERLRHMDEQGIDIQVVGINPFWYRADPDLARRLCGLQNEKIASLCAAHPDRFLGLASVALQHPDIAVQQLVDATKKFGMKGALVGGSVNGEELASPRFHPFWAKAEELGSLIFIHPQGFPDAGKRLQGNGALFNVIGNPLETTVALSHLIFEGTLDRFPGLKICGAHGGGYLPSYIARSDRCATREPAPCRNITPIKKAPSEYIKQLYFDTMVFTSEGLRHLVAEAGVSQVMLGTDFPAGWGSDFVDHVLNTTSLSDADKRAILGENAARLLGLAL